MDFQESLQKEMGEIPTNESINEDFVHKILSEINSKLGGKVQRDISGNITSVEIKNEAMGNCWIDIAANKEAQEFIIQKYFQSEFLDDEYGMTKRIPIQQNYYNNIVTIQAVVNSLL